MSEPLAHAYTRVSTGRQADSGLSYSGHARNMAGYADRLGLDLGDEVEAADDSGETFPSRERIYFEQVSALKTPFRKRPVGGRLFDGVPPGDHLLLADSDRAFRNVEDALATVRILMERGVVVHVLDGSGAIDLTTPDGNIWFIIRAAIAQYESVHRGDRVAMAHAAARERGCPNTSLPDPGFRYVGKGRDRRMVADPECLGHVALVVELHGKGWNVPQIRRELKKQGVTDPTRSRRQQAAYGAHYGLKRIRQIIAEGRPLLAFCRRHGGDLAEAAERYRDTKMEDVRLRKERIKEERARRRLEKARKKWMADTREALLLTR